MPASSKMVGPMSMQWVNWLRSPPGVGDQPGVADGHALPGSAQVGGDLLAPLERAVPGPGPGRRVVRGDQLAAPHLQPAVLLDQRELLLGGQRDAVLHRELVERAGERAFHAGAVVAVDVDHQRVVQLAHLLDRGDHPAHVPVGVLAVPRVDLHLPRVEGLLVLGQGIPGRERLGCGESAWRRPGPRPAASAARRSPPGSASQPPSNRPLYLAAHSSGTWCGACAHPVEKYTNHGLSDPGRAPRAATRSSYRPCRRGSSTSRRPCPAAPRSSCCSR